MINSVNVIPTIFVQSTRNVAFSPRQLPKGLACVKGTKTPRTSLRHDPSPALNFRGRRIKNHSTPSKKSY